MPHTTDVLNQIKRKYWNLRSFWMPPALSKVPTMLTAEECRMLVWITQNWTDGSGAVIDLGSFLGGSTAHLAYGLSCSVREAYVEAFDQFTIADEHKEAWLYKWGYPKLDGNDMQHLFDEFVRPFGKVRGHRANIEDAVWTGGPIDVLFVDICKSWDATRRVMRQFYPSLMPANSLVIHQDFQHFQQPWVVATTEALADHLELISWTEENSAVFLCTKKITAGVVEHAINQTRDFMTTRSLIVAASQRFPFARQAEAMWQHVIALDSNHGAQNSWDLRLP